MEILHTLTLDMLERATTVTVWRYRERRIGQPNMTVCDWWSTKTDPAQSAQSEALHRKFAPGLKCDNHQMIEVKLSEEDGGHNIHLLFSDNNLYASMSSTRDPREYTWESNGLS